ncbi:MAG: hypothetical protein AAF702_41860 [Chloroflexota bacterium]
MFYANKVASQPALMWALEILADGSSTVGVQAATALEHLLREVYTSPQEDAWTFSTLTQNGFPVELAISPDEPSIRYTAEVGGPEMPVIMRLLQAERLLNSLEAGELPAEIMTELRQIQASGPLKWGAWIGARHQPDGDRYKLYAEIPPAASSQTDALLERFFGCTTLLPDETAPLVAIGQTLNSSRIELYFELEQPALKYWQITYLLRQVGLASRSKDLLGFIEQVRGYSLDQPRPKFPATTYGFSYALSTEGAPPIFSIFARIGPLLGGDGQIRSRLLSLADAYGWDLGGYARLTEPLANWAFRNEYHNAISFIIGPQGPPALHVALSPPGVLYGES